MTAAALSGSRLGRLRAAWAPLAGCTIPRPSAEPTARSPFPPAVGEGTRSAIAATTSALAARRRRPLRETSRPKAAEAYRAARVSRPWTARALSKGSCRQASRTSSQSVTGITLVPTPHPSSIGGRDPRPESSPLGAGPRTGSSKRGRRSATLSCLRIVSDNSTRPVPQACCFGRSPCAGTAGREAGPGAEPGERARRGETERARRHDRSGSERENPGMARGSSTKAASGHRGNPAAGGGRGNGGPGARRRSTRCAGTATC